MSSRTISHELVAAFKRLRLGGLLPTLAERLTLAEKEDTPLEDLLLFQTVRSLMAVAGETEAEDRVCEGGGVTFNRHRPPSEGVSNAVFRTAPLQRRYTNVTLTA